jgi:ABC-type phosphate/phosphonate transport system substrate-binding protein
MPLPGSLSESLFINVWRRRKDIDLMLHFSHVLAALGTDESSKQAMKIMSQATDMALPSGSDIRRLSSNEKQLMDILKEETGKAFQVTIPPDYGIQQIKSRLAAQKSGRRSQ